MGGRVLAAGERQALARWTAAFAELMVRLTGWSGPMDGLVWRLAGGAGHAADWREAAYGHARVPHFGDPVRNGRDFVGRQSGCRAGLFSIGRGVCRHDVASRFGHGRRRLRPPAMSWQAPFVLLDAQGSLSPRKKAARNGESNAGDKYERRTKVRPGDRTIAKTGHDPDVGQVVVGDGYVPTVTSQDDEEEPFHGFRGRNAAASSASSGGQREWIYKDPCRTLRLRFRLGFAALRCIARRTRA